MQKEFNVTGICRPAKHYMADTSAKLAHALTLVERGKYFAINRPRQYGKTTTLHAITDQLEKLGYKTYLCQTAQNYHSAWDTAILKK